MCMKVFIIYSKTYGGSLPRLICRCQLIPNESERKTDIEWNFEIRIEHFGLTVGLIFKLCVSSQASNSININNNLIS